MKNKIFHLFIPAVLPAGNTQTRYGYVHDKTTGGPVPFAHIMLNEGVIPGIAVSRSGVFELSALYPVAGKRCRQ